MLRHVIHQDAFVLIGVVCEEKVRTELLAAKHSDGGADNCEELMSRDVKAGPRHGQKADAFHMADLIDNPTNSDDK
ncbi:MAG: hypothetical protein U5K38_01765 [Woeseiaceae bacterium]|nr:hypothetical protein [Woeseiaceae bacterium]